MPVTNKHSARYLTGSIVVATADAASTVYRSGLFFSDKDFEMDVLVRTNATAANMPWTLERVLDPGDTSESSSEWRAYRRYTGDKAEGLEMSSSLGASYRVSVSKQALIDAGLNSSSGTFTLNFKFAR